MTSEPKWGETGLDGELMFKSEALPHWLQYDPNLFIQAMVHEVRERIVHGEREKR